MVTSVPPRLPFGLSLLMFICIYAVLINGHPDRPRPNAAQSRFAVCGIAAGRSFRKHDEEADGGAVDTGRIVGGREAKQNEIHYIVSLQSGIGFNPDEMDFIHFCGGSIYSATWIITAAHCFKTGVYDKEQSVYRIVAGEHLLGLPEDGEQAILVKRVIEHPFYNRANNDDNDIALLELEKPLKYTKNIRPVKLPSCDYVPKGKATISGWGHRKAAELGAENLPVSDSLQVAEVDIFSHNQCEETIKKGLLGQNKTGKFNWHENTFCAGKLDRSIDSCQGDSGGPLVCHDKDGDVLCGVVSAGFGCAQKDLPGVYSYVPHFRDWIVHVTSGE